MFDRLLEGFCQPADFFQAFCPRWEAQLLRQGAQPARKRGPQAGLADSEIMTILVLYHSSRFSNFKAFYEAVVRGAKVWVDFAFIRNVPTSVFKKRWNSVSVVPVGGVCCTRLPTLLPLLPLCPGYLHQKPRRAPFEC